LNGSRRTSANAYELKNPTNHSISRDLIERGSSGECGEVLVWLPPGIRTPIGCSRGSCPTIPALPCAFLCLAALSFLFNELRVRPHGTSQRVSFIENTGKRVANGRNVTTNVTTNSSDRHGAMYLCGSAHHPVLDLELHWVPK
jgi:hypothetical protein